MAGGLTGEARQTASVRPPGGVDRREFYAVMGLLVTLAWFTLWVRERSSYGRYLDHGRWTEIGLAANICSVLPGGEVVFPALLYVGGWVLMTAAMMLPTTLPLLEIFHRMTRTRHDGQRLLTLVVAGYLAVWLLFGLAAHALDWFLHEVARQSIWLTFNAWVLGAAVLAAAGLFQFSELKYRCLDECRTPLSFVLRHWRGGGPRREALSIGVAHGIYCVGCCWALMVLMFVVGTGSVGWMLLLGAVMAIEKNLPVGRHLAKPLGGVLMAAAVVVVFENGALPVS